LQSLQSSWPRRSLGTGSARRSDSCQQCPICRADIRLLVNAPLNAEVNRTVVGDCIVDLVGGGRVPNPLPADTRLASGTGCTLWPSGTCGPGRPQRPR
jgi:hypothetical protein